MAWLSVFKSILKSNLRHKVSSSNNVKHLNWLLKDYLHVDYLGNNQPKNIKK